VRVLDYSDKSIVLGIRPENIIESAEASVSTFQARIEVSEPKGSETFLYRITGSTELVAKVHSEHTFDMGSSIQLHMDMQQVHFFDPESERVIEAAIPIGA
jgi:multiple sugar transport system ATP-binding protein